MDAAEYRGLRDLLGVTGEWLAGQLGVGDRQGRKWENGTAPIPAGVTGELGALIDEATAAVRDIVATAEPGAVIRVPRDLPGDADRPVGWYRAIAARALVERPDLTVIYD